MGSGAWTEDPTQKAGSVEPWPPAGRHVPDLVRVTLPASTEQAVVVGPKDLLVIRVKASVSESDMDRVRATIEAGPLRGRVLLVAAEQIGVVRA